MGVIATMANERKDFERTAVQPLLTAIGLMSGTSLDGVDAALIKTDGTSVSHFGASLTQPYPAEFVAAMRIMMAAIEAGGQEDAVLIHQLTQFHADAVMALLQKENISPKDIDVIGFHGHTIWHKPEEGKTRQVGDAAWLARTTGIPVVADMRSNDMRYGGQGAPLAPLYHQALAAKTPKPVAFINIGGVSNITYIGEGEAILAFDCGPGNTLIDQLVQAKTGASCDFEGVLAARGAVDPAIVQAMMQHQGIEAAPPKSIDILDFDGTRLAQLPLEDAVATLIQLTVKAIAYQRRFLPDEPRAYYITGGGRHNPVMMQRLADVLPNVQPVEAQGWDGDAIEAQAFAFLAVRSRYGLPLTVPGTTGVKAPVTGGEYVKVG